MNFSYELINATHIVEVPCNIQANDAVNILQSKGFGSIWKIV